MSFSTFLKKVKNVIPDERLLEDPLDLIAHGTDASFYRLNPKLVIKPKTEQQVQDIILAANEENIPLTFRAAGTSLSGQAVTDSVLVKIGHDWKGFNIEEEGEKVSLQPGVIGSWANQLLTPYNKKIGPDPASIDSAMIGGIVANNASGMCCGTAQNSYQTLAGMRLILADGTQLNSRDTNSVEAFRCSHKKMLNHLTSMRNEILADPKLHSLIEKKYSIKNTSGYGINSFIDFEDPIEILLHLMVGSEGTLAFISETTFQTVENPPYFSCALVFFNSIETACKATATLKSNPVSAVELMDERALSLMTGKAGVPDEIPPGTMALLIDVRANTESQLQQKIATVTTTLSSFDTAPNFSTDAKQYNDLWTVRKGLFPIVGAHRKVGTTVIIEDICFPLDELASGTLALQELLDYYGYDEAVIFGHALEGNLHFVFTQDFNSASEVERYDAFMQELSTLICQKFTGSLKAEHGTGRNMAPFVEIEWGHKAYSLMKRIKNLFDPKNILNPDVIISNKPQLHIENLKQTPAADPLIDHCIECGFCESVCPSRDLTLSPRQRITLWREIQHRKVNNLPVKELLTAFDYSGIDTCAGDGMCSTRCPVNIDTGKLVKHLRAIKHNNVSSTLAQWTGDHFSLLSQCAKTGLGMAELSRKLVGVHRFNNYPRRAHTPTTLKTTNHSDSVVYFNSCIHRVMGSDYEKGNFEIITNLLDRAGYNVILPKQSNQLCCGLPYESKGYVDTANHKMQELEAALLEASDNGRFPIICDNSPCSYLAIEKLNNESIKLYDAPTFFAERLDRLSIQDNDDPILIYSVCSQKKATESDSLLKIARACSTNVSEISEIACCGFGGDRGFSHPELNASALRTLPEQAKGCSAGYTSSRTCEIGLQTQSNIPFSNILQLLEQRSINTLVSE